MSKSRFAGAALVLTLAASLGGCGERADDPELRVANDWLQQIKRERRADAELYAQECREELGLSFTRDGMLQMIGCMQRKDRAA